MTTSLFRQSVHNSAPPQKISVYLQATWYDAKGDREKAHTLIQDLNDNDAAWIHAYLHRKEGDDGNAGYWYSRAAKRRPGISLEAEWETIVSALL